MMRALVSGISATVVNGLAFPYAEQDGQCASESASDQLRNARGRLAKLPIGGGQDLLAARLLREAAALCPSDTSVVDEVGEGLRLLGNGKEAMQLYVDAARRGLWRHPLQRILDDVKQLPTAAMLGPAAYRDMPELQVVLDYFQSRLDTFLLEFLSVRRSLAGVKSTISRSPCPRKLTCWFEATYPNVFRWNEGSWRHYYVKHPGQMCDHAHFYHTCNAVDILTSKGIDILMLAVSEVIGPRTYIPRHRSPNQRLRLLCPFVVASNASSVIRFPGFGERRYEKNICWWFDESYEHEMLHVGPTRAALIVDVAHPAADGRTMDISWDDSLLGKLGPSSLVDELPVAEPHAWGPVAPTCWGGVKVLKDRGLGIRLNPQACCFPDNPLCWDGVNRTYSRCCKESLRSTVPSN